jgi:hypothetical protein
MKKLLVGLMTGLLLLGATGASAQTTTPPTFRNERVWFHCGGTTKVQNASVVESAVPSWNTTAPTQSVQSGAGCGFADSLLLGTAPANLYDAVWSGTFKGNLQSMTVELHSIYAGAGRALATYGIAARVVIDGKDQTGNVTVVPVRSSTGASEMVRFTIVGLERVFGTEPGDGAKTHTITLSINNRFVDANPFGAWVFDTTEVPAGITFNPATPEAATLALPFS